MSKRKISPKSKRYYREQIKRVLNFHLDLSPGSWYNLWHTHVDRKGYSRCSCKQKRLHFLALFTIFRKIKEQVVNYQEPFQTWVFIIPSDSRSDSVYFHTHNPHSEFPLSFDFVQWDVDVPSWLKEDVDLNTMQIGKHFYNGEIQYYVRWKGY